MVRHGGRIACAVQYAYDDDRGRKRPVIDRIAIMECDTQAGRELVPLRTCERKMPHRLDRRFKPGDKAICDRLGSFRREIGPDFREILLGGLGEAKG